MASKFCKHYRGMFKTDKCEAGVDFLSLEHYGTRKFREFCPCFGADSAGHCEMSEYPTPEEMAKEDRELDELFENVSTARTAIVEKCNGPWKRGMPGVTGTVECPVCGGDLRFSRAAYNGHVHASCKTKDCLSWME